MNLDQKNIIIFESKYQLERYKASNPSFFEDLEVLTDLEILPYDNFSPDPSLLGKRIETLRSLIEDEVSLVCTASSIIQPLFDKKYIFEKTFEISKNQQIDLSRLTKFLINSGYERADLVVKNGQYAVRGSVIDIFPSNSKLPIRIDLFDDEVISIKYFKNEDQITFKEIDSYKCIAAKGYELTNESIDIFKKNFDEPFSDSACFPLLAISKFAKEKVDVVQVDKFLESHFGNAPAHPDSSPNEDDDIPPRPPVHPLRGAQLARGSLWRFVYLDSICQLRAQLKGLFRRWVHGSHQEGDDEYDNNDKNEVKSGENCISGRYGRV